MRFRSALAVFAVCGLTTTRAIAQYPNQPPPGGAEAYIEEGLALREQGRDREALDRFQQAYAMAPEPRFLAQVALAEQALGMWRDAERDLGKAVAHESDDAWIKAHHDALAQALTTIGMHLGTLQVITDTPNAELFLDGHSLGPVESGASYRVEIGTRNVELRAPGKYSSSRSVLVNAGDVARETIDLQPLPAQSGDGTQGPRHLDEHMSDAYANSEHAGSTQRNIGWVFLGTAGAFAVAGVVGVVARNAEIGSYNDDASCPGLHSLDQPPICESKVTTAQTWTTVSILSFVGSGVLAAGGAVLVLTAPKSGARGDSKEKPRSPGLFPDFELACAGLPGITCFARF